MDGVDGRRSGSITCTTGTDSRVVEEEGSQCQSGWLLVKGETSDYCQNQNCPANADGAPACKCSDGYWGTLTLNANQDWEGSCELCATIPDYSGALTCSSATDSKGTDATACVDGKKLDTEVVPNECKRMQAGWLSWLSS
jgi:hypothetical protein